MNTGKVWDEWCEYFTRLGYRCYQPSWLYMERSIEEQQQAPDPLLAEVTFDQVVQHYSQQIEALDERPILIGHSLGGVLVQKLVELGYAQAAICIHSGPPKGLVVWNRDFFVNEKVKVIDGQKGQLKNRFVVTYSEKRAHKD